MIIKEILISGFRDYQKGRGLSAKTITRSGYLLGRFLNWLGEYDIREVNRKKILSYRECLSVMISRFTGRLLNPVSIQMDMIVLKSFFEYLFIHELILTNPFEGLRFKKTSCKNMRSIFTEQDINLFLDSIPVTTPHGMRDRALFELMYSSGLRINETLNIKTTHINPDERTLFIKLGKGSKDRYVPFSKTALIWLLKYMGGGRKIYARRIRRLSDKRYLFLGYKGGVSYELIKMRFRAYLKDCGLAGKGYTIHSVRHACATHLLLHGANIRYVQELLGHENLQTTQVYTRPTNENIKKVYRTYHPRENEYFKEVDSKYVKQVRSLKSRLMWGERACEQYRNTGHKRGFGRWKED